MRVSFALLLILIQQILYPLLKIQMMMILTGKNILGRGVSNSPLYGFSRLFLSVVLLLSAIGLYAQSDVSVPVYRHDSNSRYYGKMFLPAGSKYYVDFHPADGVTIGVYSAYIDGENIFLQSSGLVEGRYMIDATERDMMFIVRSNTADNVVAHTVPADLSDWMDENEFFYYDATDARRNALKWATAAISNETLKTDYPKKRIYVMANPAKNDLAFALLDHRGTSRGLAQNSLYLVSRKNYSARLNIVWTDEPDMDDAQTTGIHEFATTENPELDNACYTLQGVQVGEPQQGSLYIRHGKKVIAR